MRTAIFLFTAKIEVVPLDNNWSNHQATSQVRNVTTLKLVKMLTTKLINEGLLQLCTQLKQLRKESLYRPVIISKSYILIYPAKDKPSQFCPVNRSGH